MSNSVRLPAWSKILVGTVLACGMTGIIGSIGLVYYFNETAKQATNPAYISNIAKSIADFPEQLPDGFSYQLAATVFGANLLTILHKPDNTILMIGMKPQPADTPEIKAREITNDLADKGIPNVTDEIQIDKSGSEPVAGQTLEYVIGSSSDRDGHPVSSMIGCIAVKDKKKLVLIYGLSQSKSYNFPATQTLLSSIKGF